MSTEGAGPPHGRTAMVEAVVAVEADPSLGSGDLEELAQEVALRIERALADRFGSLPAAVRIEDVSIDLPEHVPFFPATFGESVCRDPLDVDEAVGSLRRDTPLAGLLYDCAGRAFRVSVRTRFRRDRSEDREAPGLRTPAPAAAVGPETGGEP